MGLMDKLFKGNTLYYGGCLTRSAAREISTSYRILLRKAGVDFIELPNKEICCGSPALNSGHKEEAKELARKNLKLFRDHGIKRIITSCPGCFRVFSQDYSALLGKDWDLKVEHITQTLDRSVKEGKLNIPKPSKTITVTYHDPCHLGRYCGVYEEPRNLIKLAGGKLIEMKLNKKNSFCCGGGAGVRSNYKELSNAMARERLEMAEETKVRCLVTTCPMCYLNLKKNSKGLDVLELGQFLRGEENNNVEGK